MRQEIKNQQGDRLVYGSDHIEGMFFEVWGSDNILLDSDSQKNNPLLTIKAIASLVERWGFDLSAEVIEDVVEYD
jgi:hypothetical protein